MDIESLQGLEKQLDKLMEEKSTKAGVYSVPPVAQGVTELHVENILGCHLPNFYIHVRH